MQKKLPISSFPREIPLPLSSECHGPFPRSLVLISPLLFLWFLELVFFLPLVCSPLAQPNETLRETKEKNCHMVPFATKHPWGHDAVCFTNQSCWTNWSVSCTGWRKMRAHILFGLKIQCLSCWLEKIEHYSACVCTSGYCVPVVSVALWRGVFIPVFRCAVIWLFCCWLIIRLDFGLDLLLGLRGFLRSILWAVL